MAIRTKVAIVAGAGLLGVATASPAIIAAANPTDTSSVTSTTQTSTRPDAAAGWLVSKLNDGRWATGWQPGVANADWGLTIDTMWGIQSARPNSTAIKPIWNTVAAYSFHYIQYDGDYFPGSIGKLMYAASTVGADPKSIAGRNLRPRLLSYVPTTATAKVPAGLISTGPDDHKASLLGQAYAMLGLQRSGGAPKVMTTYLLGEQCRQGHFRMYADVSTGRYRTCDQAGSAPDADGTALALDALIATGGPRTAITRAVSYLLSAQDASGGWKGGQTTAVVNSNTTGVVSAALQAAADHLGAKDPLTPAIKLARSRAHTYVARIQAYPSTDASTKLNNQYGAIAYTNADYATGRTAGITDTTLGSWHRATAQGVFALTGRSLLALAPSAAVAPTTAPTAPTATPTATATTPTTSAQPSTAATTMPTTTAPSDAATTTVTSTTTTLPPNVNTGESSGSGGLFALFGGLVALAGIAGLRGRRQGRHRA